jgi:hypothetical protein
LRLCSWAVDGAGQVVVGRVQARLLDLLPEPAHGVQVGLAAAIAEALPAAVEAAAQPTVHLDCALDAEGQVDRRIDTQPLLGRVELAELTQHARVDGALALRGTRAVERGLVGRTRAAHGAQRLVAEPLLCQQPARVLVPLRRLEQRQREGQAAAVRLGPVEPLHDALQVVARGGLGRDHVRVGTHAPIVQQAHDGAERIEIAIDSELLRTQQDQARQVLVHVGERGDEAGVGRLAQRERVERLVGRFEGHDDAEPEVQHLGDELARVPPLE